MLFKVYKNNTTFWKMGRVKQRVGELDTWPKNIHKRHLNLEKKFRVNDSNVSPPQIWEQPIDIIFENLTSTHPRLILRLDVQTGIGSLRILWASILKRENAKHFFSSEKKNFFEGGFYGTVTYPLMHSSKFYFNREPSTLEEIGYTTDIRLTSKPSLRHLFSLYLVTLIYL